MSSLISSVAWVKRGAAAQQPNKYVLDDKELERVAELAHIELEDARTELMRAHAAAQSMGQEPELDDVEDEGSESGWVDEDDDVPMDQDGAAPQKSAKPKGDLSEYNLDNYDEEEDSAGQLGPFSSRKGLTFYRDNNEDPYITLKEDEEDDEREDLEVLPSDNLLVTAKTEDDVSQLEIYVYDDSSENLYVHHDLMLPNFPLCLEWLDFPPLTASSSSSDAMDTDTPASRQFGNYIAVGTMDPEIEIWSLDVVEAIYPDAVLGRPDKTAAHVPVPAGTGKKKKKKSKHRAVEAAHHVDAVLGLSWNKTARQLLASASADRTVKLWDLTRAGEAIRSYDSHKDKVQAVQWNGAQDPTTLLTGSYDRTVRIFDSRTSDVQRGATLGADVEAVRWDPHDTFGFYVSLENGIVLNFDTRTLANDLSNTRPPRFTLAAHDGAASALDVNPHIPGCIVTGGTDKMVKVWNVAGLDNGGKREVSLVTSRDLGVGKVFSASFSPDDPLTLAAAGSKARLQIWDVGANAGARKAFAPKLSAMGRALRERERSNAGVIGVVDDAESSDEGGDEE
ncbi:WD40 repeat-like protein [Peniophora sp. CONT]|nr:WD40 repeat-like protein [Peniophora sp. CONT]